MIKRILSLFLAVILLFNLSGCSSDKLDIEQLALDYINNGIKYGNGFLSQLDTKNAEYKAILNQLQNNSYFGEEEKNKYLTIWENNYNQYKKWFSNVAGTERISDKNFKTNITWVLSPSTLACLYNYYQILNIINKYRDLNVKYKSFIVPTSFKPERDYQMCEIVSNPKNSQIFGPYIGDDKITSVDKMDNIYEILTKNLDMGVQKKIKDVNENPWFSDMPLILTSKDDISGAKFDGLKELAPIVDTKNIDDTTVKIFKGQSKIERKVDTDTDNYPDPQKLFDSLTYLNDKNLGENEYFIKVSKSFKEAGLCGVLYVDQKVNKWTTHTPGSKVVHYYTEVTRQLQWDIAPFIIFTDPSNNQEGGKAYQLETFPNMLKNQNQIIDFVFSEPSEIQQKINVNSTIKGISTVQERISNTGKSDDQINISSKVFQYQDDTIDNIVELFKSYRAYKNKNQDNAKNIAYEILTQFVDGENIETDEIFQSTKGGTFTNNLTFENIFNVMVTNQIDNNWNKYQNDWLFTVNSVPFMAIRAYQLRQDAAEHLSDKSNEATSDDPYKHEMPYKNKNDSKISGKAIVNTQVKIDVIDKISDAGFTTTDSSGLYFDLWSDISEQTKAGLIKPTDNDIENGVIKQNYKLNHSYWKAPNGHMLLAKYYATYDIGQIDNTEGNQSWSGPTPIGRAMYLNTNNVNYDRENNIYTWKKSDQPVFYMADPSTNEYPSILNGMQIYLSDLGTGSLEGLDNSLEQELAVPDYSLLTRGGN